MPQTKSKCSKHTYKRGFTHFLGEWNEDGVVAIVEMLCLVAHGASKEWGKNGKKWK